MIKRPSDCRALHPRASSQPVSLWNPPPAPGATPKMSIKISGHATPADVPRETVPASPGNLAPTAASTLFRITRY